MSQDVMPEQSSAQVVEPSNLFTHSLPPPHTPPPQMIRAQLITKKSPKTLNKEEMNANMATAFKPFEQYIRYLAEGKLDGYFNSTRRQDKATDLTVVMSTDPMLLLLDLGDLTDEARIERLFIGGTIHLFNT